MACNADEDCGKEIIMKYSFTTLLWLLSVLGTLPACASPLMYSAEPIEARVVDAETKKPVEGVVVTANWQLFHSTVGGRVPGSQLMVAETVTDKEGRFAFPAWGPKLALSGYLDNYDPQLLLFKSGYEYRRLGNPVSSVTDHSTTRRSQWNGRTIEMKKFTGTPKEWLRTLEHSIPGGTREDAKQFPILLKTILAEENSVPELIDEKRPFFDNVRSLLSEKLK